ncbi:MAG: UbiH/UbiF/VisC/COQ6 family ubiquinone biosynthesis hydroxylase [Pseudomonadota bacterium]
MAQRTGPQVYDCVIAGGGLVGLIQAIALARHGFAVAVVDARPAETVLAPAFDGRASAFAFAGIKLFTALGIWPRLHNEAQPILEIRVTDGPSRLFVHFDHRAIGDQPLGHMLENRHIRLALHEVAAATPGLDFYAPATVEGVEFSAGHGTLALADGRRLKGRLVIAADGRASPLRHAAGIGVAAWAYPQTGIVATVHHAQPHGGIAHERFLAAGPFAILPLTGRRASIVWTARADQAPVILGLDERGFAAELARRFGDFLGPLEVEARRWSYPLAFHHAHRYQAERLVLIGDAAHGIHPIAGQGLNLGLKDVAALTEVLVDAARLGRDIGTLGVLERYARWRRTDTLLLSAATDGLNRLFSNDSAPLRLARDLGLGLVNRLPPAKRLFMAHARGTLGRLPRLLKGELV